MATTTTNYGFDVPTSSDLVKNGATAISTLGQDIDTFLFRPFSKNAVINGAMDIWQRGTASTAIGSGTFLADRWQAARAGFAAGASQSRQVTGDTTNLPNIQYCARVQRDSGNTSTATIYLGQNLESVNSIPYAGKTVTLSFYARKGANFSQTSSSIDSAFASGTGTDQNIVTSGTLTGINNTITTHTLTTTWQRFTVTKTIDATATQLALEFYYAPTGTAGAADYFEITGVQLEAGSQATPFSRAGGTIQGELAACQRYYYRQNVGSATGFIGTFGPAWGANNVDTWHPFPVQMRVTPTSIDTSAMTANDNVGSIVSATSAVNNCQNNVQGNVRFSFTGSPLTTYRMYCAVGNNNANAYIGFNAEL